jgi:hypothetical protein
MFITNTAFKHPMSSLFLTDPGEKYWMAVELALHKPWFVVAVCENESTDKGDELCRMKTVLVDNVSDVQNLAEQDADAAPQLESAQIVTPGHINGTGAWKMELLSAVWVADEPAAPGRIVEICETATGAKYVTSSCTTPLCELENLTLRYRFPVQACTP